MGDWRPSAEAFEQLISPDTGDAAVSRPYPFCLAHPLPGEPETLGDISGWQAEWKWDGIRAQLIRRKGRVFIWTRGEELVTERYPEVSESAMMIPDGTVMDGELLAWRDGQVLPFGELQRRIGRKKVGPKLLSEVPVSFLAFDVLEHEGADIRDRPLKERRSILDAMLSAFPAGTIRTADVLDAGTWGDLERYQSQSRANLVEGLMLKDVNAGYEVGRKTGVWWKWKVAPFTVDAVMIYAQRGHGKRASLYTDYTLAVWDDGTLVPFAKAYSGLSDAEIRKVDRFVRSNTVERFGPVRSVTPELVFEIAFEGIRDSRRHKSGVAVRFPRIVRWRTDKRPEDADTLESLRALLPTSTGATSGS